MSWHKRSTRYGGGDHPLDNIKKFKYSFRSDPWHLVMPYKVKFVIPFDITSEWHPDDSTGILERAPFEIQGTNVMEWARNCITQDQAYFEFKVDLGLNYFLTNKRTTQLTAKFGNRAHAALFKLAFLGNF
jgi:hypothetical protein